MRCTLDLHLEKGIAHAMPFFLFSSVAAERRSLVYYCTSTVTLYIGLSL